MNSVKTNSAILLSILALSLLLTNCGDKGSGNDDPTLEGTWNLTQLIINAVILNDTLTPGDDDIKGTLIFKSDDSFTSDVDISYTVTGVGQIDTTLSMAGTWSATEDSLTMGDPITGTQTFAYDLSSKELETKNTFNIDYNGVAIPVNLFLSWEK